MGTLCCVLLIHYSATQIEGADFYVRYAHTKIHTVQFRSWFMRVLPLSMINRSQFPLLFRSLLSFQFFQQNVLIDRQDLIESDIVFHIYLRPCEWCLLLPVRTYEALASSILPHTRTQWCTIFIFCPSIHSHVIFFSSYAVRFIMPIDVRRHIIDGHLGPAFRSGTGRAGPRTPYIEVKEQTGKAEICWTYCITL